MSTTLAVKIVPKSHRSEIVGWENGELKIRLKAIPEGGKANDALLEFLSDALYIPKTRIEILRGKSNPHKLVRLTGLSKEQLEKRLPPR